MKKIIIDGGQSLDGVIEVSGMKNSALPIIFACLLIKEECVLDNMPRVSDVHNSLKILRQMGAEADFVDAHTIKINTKNAQNIYFDMDLISGRYTVDAKSIMGIFSLDLSKPITIEVHSDNCDALVEELKPYIQ